MKNYFLVFGLIYCLSACSEPVAPVTPIVVKTAIELSTYTGDPNLKRNIILIFDDSGSMKGSPLARAKKATISLAQSLTNEYNFGLYGLNNQYVIPLIPIEGVINNVADKINSLGAGGGTPITDAINESVNYLSIQKQDQADYGSYTIIIVTDGAADDNDTMLKAVDLAISHGINMKTIGLDIGNHGLRKVTHFVEASSTDELTAALKKAVKAEIPDDGTFVPQDF